MSITGWKVMEYLLIVNYQPGSWRNVYRTSFFKCMSTNSSTAILVVRSGSSMYFLLTSGAGENEVENEGTGKGGFCRKNL